FRRRFARRPIGPGPAATRGRSLEGVPPTRRGSARTRSPRTRGHGSGFGGPMRPWLSLLLLSFAPELVSNPSPALASPGVNLAWNDCLPAAGSATMMPFDCNDDATTHRLVGSFIPP